MKRLLPILAMCLLVSLACGLPNVTIEWPAETPPVTQPPVQPSIPTQSPVPIQNIVTAQPADTQPTNPPPLNQPVALAVVQGDREVVSFYGLDGQPRAEVATPGIISLDPERVHIAGRWTGARPPVIYSRFDNGGQVMININDQVSLLADAPDFAGMAGMIGEPILAYSNAMFGQVALRSQLFVSHTASLGSALPVLDLENPEGNAVIPLAIRAEGGAPVGVWYTQRPWGIGGDIVFDPTGGVYYLNLSDGTTTERLGRESHTVSLSPDQVWVAYASGMPGNGTFHIYNLLTGENFGFNPLASSDRGAGYGVFSPSNAYVAWMEGSGSGMAEVPNFHPTLRIGTTKGEWLVDYSDAALSSQLGTAVAWVRPVGWLDDQRLVVQVHGIDWDDAFVVIVDIAANRATFLVTGTFVGMVYP